MAFYKWITDTPTGREPIWPAPNVWSNPVYPIAGRAGYQTVVGAHVCLAIPRHFPARLWEVEVDGHYNADQWGTAWEKVRLIQYYGTVRQEQASELAVVWARCVFDSEYQLGLLTEQEYERTKLQFEKLEEGDLDVGKCTYTPLSLAIRSFEPPLEAGWGCAKQIPLHCGVKSVLLEMARRTTERLDHDEVPMSEV